MTTSVMTTNTTDEDKAIATIVLSFGADPPARWMYPEPQQYLANFPLFTRAFGGGAIAQQSAYYVENFAGVALWLPPGVHADEQALGALMERTVGPDKLPQLFAIIEQLGEFHPKESHWYLPMIGVDPGQQGKGYGSMLMRHALQRVDQDHLPAYLESTNPANIPLYERHGFELVGKIEVADAPPFFPMIRKRR